MWDSAISTRFPHFSMSAIQQLCGFAAGLERLLSARDAGALDEMWEELNLGQVGWEALALARRANTEALEPALAEVDRRLLAVLERCRAFLDPHIVTFRVPELERWQHAAAAALVGARWGVAGLRTVIADTRAPLGRRYFAFLALAERHPKQAWPLFAKYLEAAGAGGGSGGCAGTGAAGWRQVGVARWLAVGRARRRGGWRVGELSERA